jgi:hypothetical protein
MRSNPPTLAGPLSLVGRRADAIQPVAQRWGKGRPRTGRCEQSRDFVPPFTEQDEIIAYVRLETAKLDALAAKLRRHVNLLGEYRTALISAAVTGKIDVREA